MILSVFVGAIYATRLTELPLRGEETRRAQIAAEMRASGDYVVPRQQGQPFLSRPPLQNWLIGLSGAARGEIDPVAVRLPSVVAMVLTTLLVYLYSRTFLSVTGATAAAIGFATAGQALELGRLGETEALFTLLVSGSLLVWHAGQVGIERGGLFLSERGGRRVATAAWIAAWALVGLGTLAKGPQASAYFVASIGVYLLLARRPRELFTVGNFVGAAVFLLIWGAWQWPFFQSLGWPGIKGIYGGDVALRFEDTRVLKIVAHLGKFPLEVFACLLPWSILLLGYVAPGLRRAARRAGPQVLFLLVALAVTFPTCWLVPGARGRYYMPLYPCVAPLIGLVVERCTAVGAPEAWQVFWRRFVGAMAIVLPVAGVVIVLRMFSPGKLLQPPPYFRPQEALPFAAAALVAGAVLWRLRQRSDRRAALAAVWSLGAFLGVAYATVILGDLAAASTPPLTAQVERLRASLPPGTQLTSLGYVDHVFAYYWREPIRYLPWPAEEKQVPGEVEYFCFGNDGPSPGPVPLRYEVVDKFSCDRTITAEPKRVVTVAKRIKSRGP